MANEMAEIKLNQRSKKSQTLLHSTNSSQIYSTIRLFTAQIHMKIRLVYSVTEPPQKAINSKLFLKFVTYDKKMPKFFSFSKTPK